MLGRWSGRRFGWPEIPRVLSAERARRPRGAELKRPANRSANVKLRLPAGTLPKMFDTSGVAVLFVSVPLPRLKVNVSVSSASKPRNVAVSEPAVVVIVALRLPPVWTDVVPVGLYR